MSVKTIDEPVFYHPKYTLTDNDILKRNDDDDNNDNSDEEVIAEIARYIEAVIIHKFHFVSLVVPDDSAPVSTSVLASNDWETNERLLLIVQNANGCKLGIFSRTFCLEKGLYHYYYFCYYYYYYYYHYHHHY